MSSLVTYSARWIFPVSGPPVARGTVSVRNGRIVSVDPYGARKGDEDLGHVAVIPGLVNAHTHLDLSGARGLVPPTDPAHFTDWLRGVIAYRRTRTAEQLQADIRAGLAEALAAGTTLIGDIAADGASWDAFARAEARAVVFREVIGLSKQRSEDVLAAAGEWLADHPATDTCRPGLSPHAPYSVRPELFAGIADLCRARGLPQAIHLAESPAETELLYQRTGPFVGFLKGLGLWEKAKFVQGFQQAMREHDTYRPVLFAHGNYLPAGMRFRRSQSLVYCPRTHAAFGHPPHPFRTFLDRGTLVCLGTDSLASNPDLDLLAEARQVHRLYPDLPGDALLRMATVNGAEALGFGDVCGTLEPGKSADMVVVPLPPGDTGDPHNRLFADFPGDRRTVFRGQWRG